MCVDQGPSMRFFRVASVRPSGSSYRVLLEDGSEVPVSRRRAATLLERLGV